MCNRQIALFRLDHTQKTDSILPDNWAITTIKRLRRFQL